MAYNGTTAGTTLSNPPLQIARGVAGGILGSTQQGTGLWFYTTTDGSTVLESATYFTDGFYLGMRQGDMVLGAFSFQATASTLTGSFLGVVGAVTTAGCGLSTYGTMTSTFN